MDGKTHCLAANLALACLEQRARHILYPRWGGIEAGATLSDEFRIMWEIREAGSTERHLIHRCFVDSDDPRNHGCVLHASAYTNLASPAVEKIVLGPQAIAVAALDEVLVPIYSQAVAVGDLADQDFEAQLTCNIRLFPAR